MKRALLAVALDGSDRAWIEAMIERVGAEVDWVKVGLEAFTAFGPELPRSLAAEGCELFLDLKLHDIPTTVRRAAANAAALGAAALTVHASGGPAMIAAAVEGVREGRPAGRPETRVVAVTVLTSLAAADLRRLGVEGDPESVVVRWAVLAAEAGAHGVVASPREAAAVRETCGPDLLVVTPGIRPDGAAADDQQRTLTPAQAVEAGADVLVVGRPITRAADPRAAAAAIRTSIP